GLVERILEDVRRQPGSLPLLQYALKGLYERRSGRTLTHAAYDAIGGVEQALAKHAESVYIALNAAQQDIVRRVLLRLVEIGDTGEATRRRVQREDLSFQGVAPQTVQEILDLMTAADSRLLITSREIKASDDTRTAPVTYFEVSHEALIREWERFKTWIADNLEDLRYGGELLKAAADWNQGGRDSAYLLTGNRLLRAELWVQNADANPLQREFISASIAARATRDAEREQQAERELTLQKQAAARLRGFVAVLIVGLIVAVGLAVFALNESQRAEANARAAAENARVAELNEAEARSFGLSASGERALLDGENELAVALAVEAALVTENPPPQTRLTLSNVVYAPGTRRVLPQSTSVNAVLLLPGDDFALVGADGGALVKVDLATGDPVLTFTGHPRDVTAVGVNRAGTLVVSGSVDGKIILWDAVTGAIIRSVAQKGRITAIAFNADDSTFVTASNSGSLFVWDGTTGAFQRSLVGHLESITSALFHPANPAVLLTAGNDDTIRLWDLTNSETPALARFVTEGDVLSLAISPDGQAVVAGFRRLPSASVAVMRLYSLDTLLETLLVTPPSVPGDTRTSQLPPALDGVLFEAGGHSDDVLTLAFSPDGTQLVSGGGRDDSSIIVWDVATRQAVLALNGHTFEVRSVVFNAAGTGLVSGASDATMRVWDLNRAEIIRDFTEHTERGVTAVFSADERTILTGGADTTLRLWDVATGLTLQEFIGHTDRVFSVDLSADGMQALSGGEDGSVIVWDVASGEPRLSIAVDVGEVNKLRFTPGDLQFVVAGSSGGLALWDTVSGQRVRSFGNVANSVAINALALSTDGTLLATGGAEQRVSLWEMETGTLRRQLESAGTNVRALAISPDGTQIAVGGQNGSILVWSVDGELLDTLNGHDRAVVGLAFAPDGEALLSGALDATLRLWDLASGFEVRRYDLGDQGANLQSVTLSAAGDIILSGQTDSSARLWRLLPTVDELLAWTFKNRYITALTCDQRVQFRLDPCVDGIAPERPAFTPPPIPSPQPSLLYLQTGAIAAINSLAGDNIRLRVTPSIVSDENILQNLADGTRVTLLEGPVMAEGLMWWRVRVDVDASEGYVVEQLPDESLQILVPLAVFE
ncbi:MAG: WD40 repeat domain-containing protein, partial [Armatimonadetes bacterium]|nr:WD40 repeat domain-containing protein [Anaerolineae bacterium]